MIDGIDLDELPSILLPSKRFEIERQFNSWCARPQSGFAGTISPTPFNFVIWLMTTDEGKKALTEMYEKVLKPEKVF